MCDLKNVAITEDMIREGMLAIYGEVTTWIDDGETARERALVMAFVAMLTNSPDPALSRAGSKLSKRLSGTGSFE